MGGLRRVVGVERFGNEDDDDDDDDDGGGQFEVETRLLLDGV